MISTTSRMTPILLMKRIQIFKNRPMKNMKMKARMKMMTKRKMTLKANTMKRWELEWIRLQSQCRMYRFITTKGDRIRISSNLIRDSLIKGTIQLTTRDWVNRLISLKAIMSSYKRSRLIAMPLLNTTPECRASSSPPLGTLVPDRVVKAQSKGLSKISNNKDSTPTKVSSKKFITHIRIACRSHQTKEFNRLVSNLIKST
jgi:hypothetical protein